LHRHETEVSVQNVLSPPRIALASELSGDAFGAVRLVAPNDREEWQCPIRIDIDAFLTAESGAAAVALIDTELHRLPRHLLQHGSWQLSIPPVGRAGFAIDVIKHRGRQISCLFGEFEHEFDEIEKALAWAGRSLGADYQLRTICIGAKAREFYLEPVDPADARPILAGGRGLEWLSLSRSRQTIIRRNAFPPAAGPLTPKPSALD
jgi:hypothetical protein